jgi:DNA-binding CsgD family transcriptional regulator
MVVAGLFETAVRSAGIAPVVSPGLVCSASAGYAQRVLAGRDRERVAVAALIDQARASRGAALVLRGLPGVGKSALIDDAVSTAEGLLVLRTSGIESESPLAFAALQRLLRPVMDLVEPLPLPQAAALRAAFGEAEGDGDRFLVFLAALSLLAEAAEEVPVLAVVDDAQWLDEASAAALLFAARRLQAEPVALLFAAREGDVLRFDGGDLPSLTVGDLDAAAARALLSDRAGGPVPADVLERLMTATGGNPLALVELTDAVSRDQLRGRTPLPAQLPLTEGVERAFLDRYRRLPEAARTFLLVAAADDSGRVSVVRRAARALGAGDDAIDTAEVSGLIRSRDGALELRHPLVRSAVYGAALSNQRRRAHRALASALVGGQHDDRRAWHRAAAVEEPDEAVVAELDQVAGRAASRGGHEAASAAWERAAELTSAEEPRAVRLLAAAGAAWLAARPGRARSLADAGRLHVADPVLRADLDRLRARVEWNIGSASVGHRILLQAARDVAGTDQDRAREMAVMAAAAAMFGADSGVGIDPADFVGDVAEAASPKARCFALLLSGFAAVGRGELTDGAAAFRQAFTECDLAGDTDLASNLGIAAMHLGEDAVVLRQYGRQVIQARESGAVVLVLYALTRRAVSELSTGDWAAAAAGSAEALDLARAAGQAALTGLPLAWLTLLAALRGNDDEYTAHLAELEHPDRARDVGLTSVVRHDVILWAKGVASAATPATALHHLEQISHGVVQRMAAMDRIEAAIRADQPQQARAWADELAAFANATGASWASAAVAHGRALLSDGADAQALYELALERHTLSAHRAERARTQLAFGEFLRRSRRRVDARTHLRAALQTFDDLGAEPWAERARQELRASGETARRRDPSTAANLTPQELQVTRLVRRGLSNRDAAAQLFLSPRTIDFHLRNAFAKLGVTSRAELTALAPE